MPCHPAAGKPLDREDVLRQCPDLAAEWAAFFANHDKMKGLAMDAERRQSIAGSKRS